MEKEHYERITELVKIYLYNWYQGVINNFSITEIGHNLVAIDVIEMGSKYRLYGEIKAGKVVITNNHGEILMSGILS